LTFAGIACRPCGRAKATSVCCRVFQQAHGGRARVEELARLCAARVRD
jgi:hypothetical protein